LERWLGWQATDRDVLAGLAVSFKISENHLRDMMDWLEEVALRDHTPIAQVLASKVIDDLRTDPRLGRADKIKRIKEQLRRKRFPRLAQTEDEIEKRIRELKLYPEIRLSVPPGLEGGRVRIEFSAGSAAELKALVTKLSKAAASATAAEIFQHLSGTANDLRQD
jgi:hypothetical protein